MINWTVEGSCFSHDFTVMCDLKGIMVFPGLSEVFTTLLRDSSCSCEEVNLIVFKFDFFFLS